MQVTRTAAHLFIFDGSFQSQQLISFQTKRKQFKWANQWAQSFTVPQENESPKRVAKKWSQDPTNEWNVLKGRK